MQLIEAALAFAITMLALSLVVSSFVEMIHRIFSMREAGLKYLLGQMLNQVLDKHIRSGIAARVQADTSVAAADKEGKIAELVESARRGFVDRMSANRAPMGLTPSATPAGPAAPASSDPKLRSWLSKIPLWNGRDLAAMTPAEFMERLGSMEDIGKVIAEANVIAQNAAQAAGATAAEAVNVLLKDVAQKFDAFGKEASVYFEGRARLLSVGVAMALAFLAHVDAIDLFKTYLRDPNARAKVIEQADAVTAQYKAADKTMETLTGIRKNLPPAPSPAEDANMTAEQKVAAKKKEDDKKADDAKALDEQIEALKKDALATINDAKASVKQFADLGVPLGWNNVRIKRAEMRQLLWTCKDPKTGESLGKATLREECHANDKGYDGATHTQYVDVWFQVPTAPGSLFYLFLGGLLVGLGAPFWYNAVTGLTNIRNAARGTTASDAQTRAGIVVAAEAGAIQPATPVDAFRVANAAQR